MPPGKKFGGRDFKKGNPGGPGRRKGFSPIPPAIKEAKRLTAQLFQDTVNKLTSMSKDEIEEFIVSKDATMLDRMVAGQIKAAVSGKSTPVTLLLDRTVGPVKQQFHVQVDANLSDDINAMTDEQKTQYLAEIKDRMSGK